MPTKEDRKNRRVQKIREQIMDASIKIINEKGFSGTTTKEIAKNADMAEGTLYNYFKNKDDILMSIAERYISHKRHLDVSTDVDSAEEFFRNMYSPSSSDYREDHKNERNILRALLPKFLTDKKLGKLYYDRIVRPYLEMLEEKLSILQEKGIVEYDDVKALSRFVYSSFIGFAVLEINGDPEISNPSPEFSHTVSDVYIKMLYKGMEKK